FPLLVLVACHPRSAPFPYTTLFRSTIPNLRLVVKTGIQWKKYVKMRWHFSTHKIVWLTVKIMRFVFTQFPQNMVPSPRRLLHKIDRKSTRLNSSHVNRWYAVFCLTK